MDPGFKINQAQNNFPAEKEKEKKKKTSMLDKNTEKEDLKASKRRQENYVK